MKAVEGVFEGGWRVVKRVAEGLHMGLKGVERLFEGVEGWWKGC